jgi:RES domain-containing protein
VRFGDEFVREARHCLLFVPSALAPSENNVLINPAHPGSKRIKLLDLEPLRYDPRLFSKPARRRHQRG